MLRTQQKGGSLLPIACDYCSASCLIIRKVGSSLRNIKGKHIFSLLIVTLALYIIGLSGALLDQASAATGVVSASVANIRSAPEVNSTNIIGSVYKNTTVDILSQSGEWYKVQVGTLSGWMHQSVLNAASAAIPAVIAKPVAAMPEPTPAVILDGGRMQFDVPPIIEKGRTLVPLGAIFRAMGATVTWNEATSTVTATKGDINIILPIGSVAPTVNGQVWPLDVPAKLVNDRTLAPLRFVGEALGGSVSWDAVNCIVTLTSPVQAGEAVVAVTVSTALVNLRSGPSTGYDIVATARSGERLAVVNEQDGWYQVSRGAGRFWVAGWLVDVVQGGAEAVAAVIPSPVIPSIVAPPVTPPMIIPPPATSAPLEGLAISSQRSSEGLKIVMESGTKLTTKTSKTSTQISYEFAGRQINGTSSFQEYLGSSLVTVQGSNQGNSAQVIIQFPAGVQYNTITENNGAREVFIVPNYVTGVDRKTFGNTGENITVSAFAPLQYTTATTSNQLTIVFSNALIGSGQASYNYSSPLISSMGFQPRTVSGQIQTVFTINTKNAAKFAVGPSADGMSLNILFVDQSEIQARTPIVVLDAGHGGRDPGASGSVLNEKEVNLDVVTKIGNILTAKGIKVFYTRQDDTYVSLDERTNIANLCNAAVFVSVHQNANVSSGPSGTETYCYYPLDNPQLYLQKDERYNLALRLQQALVAALGTNDRGVKEGNLAVLRESAMPSALVETVFISNPTEEQLLKNQPFRSLAAQAIADAISGYMAQYVSR